MSIKGPGRDVSIRGTLKPLKRSAEEAGLPTGGPFTMVRDCDTMAAQIREDVRVAAAKQCEVQDTQEYDPQDTVLDEAALENPGTPGTTPLNCQHRTLQLLELHRRWKRAAMLTG